MIGVSLCTKGWDSTPYTSSTTGTPSKGAHAQSKNLPGEPKAMLLLLRSNFCTHLLRWGERTIGREGAVVVQ
jgi:hypothetical protein